MNAEESRMSQRFKRLTGTGRRLLVPAMFATTVPVA
jgi:hypothetical protein